MWKSKVRQNVKSIQSKRGKIKSCAATCCAASVVKEVKGDSELSRKRLWILETQPTTRISQLEGMMYNTIVKQTEQLSRELDEKNYILSGFMDNNIFQYFADSFLQNGIVSRQGNQQKFQKILMVVF